PLDCLVLVGFDNPDGIHAVGEVAQPWAWVFPLESSTRADDRQIVSLVARGKIRILVDRWHLVEQGEVVLAVPWLVEMELFVEGASPFNIREQMNPPTEVGLVASGVGPDDA